MTGGESARSALLSAVDRLQETVIPNDGGLERACAAALDARANREPAALVGATLGADAASVPGAVAAAAAADFLHARTLVRWRGLPTTVPSVAGTRGRTALILGDELQALAFRTLAHATGRRRRLYRSLTRDTLALCEFEGSAADTANGGLPDGVRAHLRDLARNLGDALDAGADGARRPDDATARRRAESDETATVFRDVREGGDDG